MARYTVVLLHDDPDAGRYVVSTSPQVPGIDGKLIWADRIEGALELVEDMLVQQDVCGPDERVPRLWRRVTAVVATLDCADRPKTLHDGRGTVTGDDSDDEEQ
jgi:hypothetical protein